MHDFDIAISFAGEDRAIAYQIATQLKDTYNYKVFYDDYEQAQLLGTNLTEYLIDIYKNKTRYCVVLISKDFKEKRWTRHEWKAAQARAFEEPDLDYILPIKIDETELVGLLPTIGYLSLEKYTIEQITNIINDKVKSEIEILKIVRNAEKLYLANKYSEALDLVSDQIFDNNIEALRIRGNSNGKLHKYTQSILAFEKIVELNPKSFLAHFHIGIYSFRSGNFEKSVKHYEKAMELYPNHPTILDDLPLARKKLLKSLKGKGKKKGIR